MSQLRTPEEVAKSIEAPMRGTEWSDVVDDIAAAIRADRLALLDEVMRRCGGLLRASLRERVVRDLRREIAGS